MPFMLVDVRWLQSGIDTPDAVTTEPLLVGRRY